MSVNTTLEHSNIKSLNKSPDNASSCNSLPSGVVHQLEKLVGKEKEPFGISETSSFSGYSNEVIHVNLDDGRSLMIKQAHYDWAGPRFRSACRASSLLRGESSVITPEHISLPEEVDNMPTLAYWYIPLPTLKDLWPDLSSKQRMNALRSLGRLLRKVHQVKVNQYGSLGDEDIHYDSVSAFMEHDLCKRLKPAIWAKWSDALPVVDHMTQMARSLPESEEGARLIHNDLHLDNILCEVENGEVRCVGLLDLEAAAGGRPESDLASAITLHDPLFAEENGKGDWLEGFDRYLKEGYGKEPDPVLLRFFRVYHLINLGFFSALGGDDWHAERVAEAARYLLDTS